MNNFDKTVLYNSIMAGTLEIENLEHLNTLVPDDIYSNSQLAKSRKALERYFNNPYSYGRRIELIKQLKRVNKWIDFHK